MTSHIVVTCTKVTLKRTPTLLHHFYHIFSKVLQGGLLLERVFYWRGSCIFQARQLGGSSIIILQGGYSIREGSSIDASTVFSVCVCAVEWQFQRSYTYILLQFAYFLDFNFLCCNYYTRLVETVAKKIAFALISPTVFIFQTYIIYHCKCKEGTETVRKWGGKGLYCKRVQSYDTERKNSIFANLCIL